MDYHAHTPAIVIAIALIQASCASLSISSDPEEVAARRARTDAKLSVRKLERILMKDYLHPNKDEMTTFLSSLRTLERDTEADAFAEFLARYAAGQPTYERPAKPTWRKCDGRQVGAKLIRRWGNGGYLPEGGRFQVGTIAATFEITQDGEIVDIRVIVAKHPAAAWLIVDTIAESRVSQSKLRRMRSESPEFFPIGLCAWWDYNEIDAGLTPGGTIRGFR